MRKKLITMIEISRFLYFFESQFLIWIVINFMSILLIYRSKRYITQRPENESCLDYHSTFVFRRVRAKPEDWLQHYVESLFQVCQGDPGMLRFLQLYGPSPAWQEQMSDLLRRRVQGMFETVQIVIDIMKIFTLFRSNKMSCNGDTN